MRTSRNEHTDAFRLKKLPRNRHQDSALWILLWILWNDGIETEPKQTVLAVRHLPVFLDPAWPFVGPKGGSSRKPQLWWHFFNKPNAKLGKGAKKYGNGKLYTTILDPVLSTEHILVRFRSLQSPGLCFNIDYGMHVTYACSTCLSRLHCGYSGSNNLVGFSSTWHVKTYTICTVQNYHSNMGCYTAQHKNTQHTQSTPEGKMKVFLMRGIRIHSLIIRLFFLRNTGKHGRDIFAGFFGILCKSP